MNESVAGSISGSRFAIDLAKLHVSSITFEQWSERQRVPLGFPAIYRRENASVLRSTLFWRGSEKKPVIIRKARGPFRSDLNCYKSNPTLMETDPCGYVILYVLK